MNYKKILLFLFLSIALVSLVLIKVQQEKNEPLSFLELSMKEWHKGQTKILGTITNKSSKTEYSNIVVIVQFYDSIERKIGTSRLVKYEIIKPHQLREFSDEMFIPNGAIKISAYIERAQFIDYEEGR